ncbi:MAG: 4-(cytidine 5'-diphospho)-2-C-methyl-D-erythritol kinase [Candidatus Dormibacteria bacterium]
MSRAPAKLNLALEVTGRRPDGYHELAAVSQTVGWSDLVGVELGAEDLSLPCRLLVGGPHSNQVPQGAQNIVLRTLELLRAAGRARPISQVVLEKRIPTRSGLGGGSADAAALIRLAATAPIDQELLDLALECGADVPFAMRGGAAQISGIGETVRPLPALKQGVFLITVLGAVSTVSAYQAVDTEDFSDGSRAESVARALAASEWPNPELLGSALQAAALRVTPGLAGALQGLRAATPTMPWAMTGSGGAFFCLVPDPDQAERAIAAVARRCPGLPIRAAIAEPEWREGT